MIQFARRGARYRLEFEDRDDGLRYVGYVDDIALIASADPAITMRSLLQIHSIRRASTWPFGPDATG
jgi:hypothetical protein